jgi:hypothetical protein
MTYKSTIVFSRLQFFCYFWGMKTRKLFNLISLALVVGGAVACHKDNPSEPQEPEVEGDTTPVGACVECEFVFSESTFSLFDVTFEFLNEDGTVTSEKVHDLKVEKKFTSYSFPCEMGARFSIALKEGLVLSELEAPQSFAFRFSYVGYRFNKNGERIGDPGSMVSSQSHTFHDPQTIPNCLEIEDTYADYTIFFEEDASIGLRHGWLVE